VLPASRVPLVASTSDDRLKSTQQDTTELWPADLNRRRSLSASSERSFGELFLEHGLLSLGHFYDLKQTL
jgi:hypothetical protein